MKKIWFSFLGVIVILSGMDIFGGYSEPMTLGILALHVALTCLVLHSSLNPYRLIFFGAFLARVLFMFWDLNGQHIFTFPNSGADSEGFFRHAVSISQDIQLIGEDIRGGLYAKINGLLFYLTGAQRIVGQYLNVLMGLSVVAIVYNIMLRLNVRPSAMKFVLLATAFFPNSLIMSAIFLREIFPTFFVAASLYFFIRWFQENAFKDVILTVAMIGIASAFHSGVIGLLMGYAFVFLFYKAKKARYQFSLQSILVFLVLAGCLTMAATRYQDIFFSKFQNVEEIEDIYSQANKRLGQSAYLRGVTIDSTSDLILLAPLKIVYFMAAPVMFDWRGPVDAATFVLDSLLYIGTFIYVLLNRKALGNRKALYIGLLLALIGALIIFGIGVSNAGTAVRHRQKLIPVFLILLAITMDAKRRMKEAAYLRRQSLIGQPAVNQGPRVITPVGSSTGVYPS